ncbi:MAG TPA: SWIM zinc finger family protein [Methanosarcina sp.]|nr:SWIM zinc finger family protein [Methanosarcina sp.]
MTLQFNAPKVGSQVRVTSRYKNNYIHATSETYDHTIEGVVLPNSKHTHPNAFAMRVKCPHVPVREVYLPNVVDLVYLDGTVASKGKIDNEIKTLEVKGSKGDTYLVVKEGNKITCTCTGFQFRKTCKHLALIK